MNHRKGYLKGFLQKTAYRIRNKYFQFLEILNNRVPDQIEKRSNFPGVKLIAVKEKTAIEALAKLYYMNPSPMVISLWKKEEIETKISDGVEFYLCYNSQNELVGATGFDPGRNMFVHSIIKRKERGNGYGPSMYLELMDLKKKRGIHEFRAQIFNNNNRAVNMMKRIGFEIDLNESNPNYLTVIKYVEK